MGGPLDALAAGGRVRTVAVDLTTENGPARTVREAVEAFGGLGIARAPSTVTPRWSPTYEAPAQPA
ncbi:hypothetical protein Slala03_72100 [Streptomyces lavendulae subsp. lavendulae]|nr:hypothetical protein Slala03_72100 [Streptomyces lavendulae subsp. lavendulae]